MGTERTAEGGEAMKIDCRAPGRGDEGTGLFGTSMGILVFLIMMFFAVHVLIGLYSRSVVAGAAFDGAQYLARHGRDKEGAAENVVRLQVARARVRPVRDTDAGFEADFVEYAVEADAPTFLSGPWWTGSNTIVRRARVRVERVR
jgi:hypothetical protein